MAQCAALGVEEAQANDWASAAVLGLVPTDALRPAVPVLPLSSDARWAIRGSKVETKN
jgi:hypothetical protein